MKNFDKIYEEIYSENYSKIHSIRNKNIIRSTIITLFFVLISIPVAIHISLVLTVIFDLIIAFLIFFNPFFNNYNKAYKSNIVTALINKYDPNLTFKPDATMSKKVYDAAGFDIYNEYNSNDYISGLLEGKTPFQMSDIHTLYVTRDENGHKTKTTTFKGLFSVSELNQIIPDKIQIRLDKKIFTSEAKDNNKINMDSQEFEKYFNVFAQNKLLTMQILTADLMNYILSFKKENNIKFEIIIKHKKLYTRIHCKNIFEGNILKNPLDYKTLKTYFKYLDFIIELNKKLNYTLSNKDL